MRWAALTPAMGAHIDALSEFMVDLSRKEAASFARIREERIAVQIEERRQLSDVAGDLVRRIRRQRDIEEARGMRAADQGPKL